MWQTMILTGMLAVTGYYSIEKTVATPPPQTVQGTSLAGSMAVYRKAVLDYLQAHPEINGQVIPDETLQSALPSWYVMPMDSLSRPLWGHQLCSDGIVVVFANQPVQVSITNDILKLAKNSAAIGESLGGKRFYSPTIGYTSSQGNNASGTGSAGVITLSGCPAIAAGRPVWIANLN